MPTANQVATELRKLADSLDAQPETVIKKASVNFRCDTKDEFLSTTNLLPRPWTKSEDTYGSEDYHRIHIKHDTEAASMDVSVYKSLTCELVERAKPAVYRCLPILSAIEEAAL